MRRKRAARLDKRQIAIRIIAIAAILLVASYALLALFEPGLAYTIEETGTDITSPDFRRVIEALADTRFLDGNQVEVLTNGDRFYPAELEAIRQASVSVHLEAYIFSAGELSQRFVEVMSERAHGGVQVRLVLDGAGSLSTRKGYFDSLHDAGGRVEWYHPIRFTTWRRYNNRTHREIIVVDGRLGFVGGAGFADQWLRSQPGEPQWRDTMFRVRGPVVAQIQAAFAQNWLESSGEVLSAPRHFPVLPKAGGTPALAVSSTPAAGRSTRARMLYQALIAHSRRSIYLATPYFVPDRSALDELLRAKERGVDVKILVPGDRNDIPPVRKTSRGLYGDLLQAGIEIYEYQPAMMHVKSLVIDGLWTVVGSTNIDNRSFGLNDEVNLVMVDEGVAERVTSDFRRDLESARRITYEEWQDRPYLERTAGWLGRLFSRQQ